MCFERASDSHGPGFGLGPQVRAGGWHKRYISLGTETEREMELDWKGKFPYNLLGISHASHPSGAREIVTGSP